MANESVTKVILDAIYKSPFSCYCIALLVIIFDSVEHSNILNKLYNKV